MTKKLKKIGLILLVLILALKIDAIVAALTFDYPDQGQTIKVGDYQVFYRQKGQGPDILFLHGIGASQNIWAKIENQFQKDFRLTLIDIPGFGRSSRLANKPYGVSAQVERLIQTLDELKIESCHLVGSSMGGALALWLKLKYPKRFQKTMVIGAATSPDLVPLPFYNFPFLGHIIYPLTSRPSMLMNYTRIFNNSENFNRARLNYSNKNQEPGSSSLQIVMKATETLADQRMPSAFSPIQDEVLILGSEKDLMVPTKYLKELNKSIPNSKLLLHKWGGHHLMEDDPAWVSDKIMIFIKNGTH